MNKTDRNIVILLLYCLWRENDSNNFLLNEYIKINDIRIHILIIICYFDVQNNFYMSILLFVIKLQNKNNKQWYEKMKFKNSDKSFMTFLMNF
jgi:hypothetical protein